MKKNLSRTTQLAIAAFTFTLVLTACSMIPSTPTPSTSDVAKTEPSKTIEVFPSSTPGPNLSTPIPVSVGCNDLLSPEAIYDFNPNFSATNAPAIETGSIQESVKKQGGLVCAIQNQSNSEIIVFGISQIPAEDLEYVTSTIANSTRSVDEYGNTPEVSGFFSEEKGIGVAQVITSGYRIFVSSSFFQEATDAKGLISTLTKRLP